MTLLCTKRPQLWTREVPGGWRVVNIRQGGSITPYYLSPQGKRFPSLKAVQTHVATLRGGKGDAEDEETPAVEISDKKRKRKRKRTVTSEGSAAKRLNLEEESESSETDTVVDLSIPPEIKKRRKLMAMRSPFRNLLKRTLVRNHNRMKYRMTTMTSKAEIVTRSKPSESEERENSPPSKRLKLDTSLPQQEADPSDTEKETETRCVEDQFSTPPRKIRREMHIFTPPNLTPPVVRRAKTTCFPQPNQRNITAGKVPVKNFLLKTVKQNSQSS